MKLFLLYNTITGKLIKYAAATSELDFSYALEENIKALEVDSFVDLTKYYMLNNELVAISQPPQ